ncbi:hypothetical protein [Pseudomonas phage PA1C]|uniref:Uncharacterized protein n=1 Tax=Pseudomonas phage vB_PaeM_PS119XW TaxID=2601632 RepID=A0A5C1K7G0_9CAUD|nr:hypothetical protein PP933_gp091 [Pseudomonas phage vB_PaeM_PS119XW]QBX32242.1 hypothetical protein [Pseudomonas phage PA1C]QEM41820.1 hypothetical protein [Pseudomonas phage vB_PaeM_PS119XW]BEG72728.1 hypothetical protein RVBP21_3560 [Pseudomonas phage BRkr]
MIDHTHDDLVHPRITKAYAKSLIVKEKIISDPEMLVTVCITKLRNGHRIVTDAIVANKAAFDSKRGVVVARRKAIEEIIRLELYLLRDKLYEHSKGNENA